MSMRFSIVSLVITCNLINAAAESEPAPVTCREAAELIKQDMVALRPQVPDPKNGELMLAYRAPRDRWHTNIIDHLERCQRVDGAYLTQVPRSIATIRGNIQSLESCVKTCPVKDRAFIQA